MRQLFWALLAWLHISLGYAAAAPVEPHTPLHLEVSTDARGTTAEFNGRVTIPHHLYQPLLAAFENRSWGSATLHHIRFNPTMQAYIIDLEVGWGWIWDVFALSVKTNAHGELCLTASGNWLPTQTIWTELSQHLRQWASKQVTQRNPYLHLTLEMHYPPGQMCVMPRLVSEPEHAPAVYQEAPSGTKTFAIGPNGDFSLTVNKIKLSGPAERTHKYLLTRILKRGKLLLSAMGQDKSLKTASERKQALDSPFSLQGELQVALSPHDTHHIQLGNENLSARADAFELQVKTALKGHFTAKGEFAFHSQNHLMFSKLRIANRVYQAESVPLAVALDSRHLLDVSIHPQYPAAVGSFLPQLSSNRVKLLVDGPAYYQALLEAFKAARHSIAVEKFLYYDGQTTRHLSRLMALKAAGLIEHQGQLQPDPQTPTGIPVRILHNHEFNTAGIKLVERHFAGVLQSLFMQLKSSTLSDRQVYMANLKRHLKWAALVRGVAKTDHRKLVVVDQQLAFIGGMNWGDHYLTADSKHDVMFAIRGPAVKEIHDHFVQNWQEFTGQPYPKLGQPLIGPVSTEGLSDVPLAILTTDDGRAEIKSALLTLIQQARHNIQLEHAYFFHHEVLEALKQALNRGVTIQLMVPRHNDEALFEILNTDAIRQLMEHQQITKRGLLQAWYYKGKGGDHGYMAHTKAMAVDGRYALVGSANLLPRSLQPPFMTRNANGHHQHFLFNEEMSVFFDSPTLVQQLEHRLFRHDRTHFGQPLTYAQVVQRIQELGGPAVLLQERLKAYFT